MSFNPHTVAAFGKAAPDVTRGLTSCDYPKTDWPMLDDDTRARLSRLEDYAASGSEFLSHYWRDLDNPAVTALAAQGVPVLCWTIRSPEQEAQARKLASGITFENYPA